MTQPSDSPTPSTPESTTPSSTGNSSPAASTGAAMEAKPREITLVSHSSLFYWWPVWMLAFFMAIWTYFENHRLAIVSPHAVIEKKEDNSYLVKFVDKDGRPKTIAETTESWRRAVGIADDNSRVAPKDAVEPFRPRMSQHSWPGAIFVTGLLLTIVITNVPLRGLWSFITIILIIMMLLLIALFDAWDRVFEAIGNLHIHINYGGYVFIGLTVFFIWAAAVFIFDRRSYVTFTPGQIRVCEHIGASIQAYNTMGISLEKQRDDLFRHYILGFGSGDLILKISAGDRREIKLPNVLGIGWQINKIEEMLKPVS